MNALVDIIDSLSDRLESLGCHKEARDLDIIANTLEGDQYLEYQNALKRMSVKFKNTFGIFPQINQLRTSKHPDYNEALSQGRPGYIDFRNKVLYVDFDRLKEPLDSFIAHELGHWLDQYLNGNNGQLGFSRKIYPEVVRELGRETKYGPEESVASTVDFLLTGGVTGPAEAIIAEKIQEALQH